MPKVSNQFKRQRHLQTLNQILLAGAALIQTRQSMVNPDIVKDLGVISLTTAVEKFFSYRISYTRASSVIEDFVSLGLFKQLSLPGDDGAPRYRIANEPAIEKELESLWRGLDTLFGGRKQNMGGSV